MTVSMLAFGLTEVSLTIMFIGAIAFAGATVVITAIPDWRFPRRRRTPTRPVTTVVHQPPVTQRRVVTGRAPQLPPVGVPLPRQTLALPDGRASTGFDVGHAEALIDQYLETDPEMLAVTISKLIALDDIPRRRHR